MWVVGVEEMVRVVWWKDGDAITTGSATVNFTRFEDDELEYLQPDGLTFDAAYNDFPMTRDGDEWQYIFTPPASMKEYNVVADCIHSDPSLPPIPDGHYVEDGKVHVEFGT